MSFISSLGKIVSSAMFSEPNTSAQELETKMPPSELSQQSEEKTISPIEINSDSESERECSTSGVSDTEEEKKQEPQEEHKEKEEEKEKKEEELKIRDIPLPPVSGIQKALKDFTFEEIRDTFKAKYDLCVKQEDSLPGLMMITYMKVGGEARYDNMKPNVCHYRGLILDSATKRPLCYTFDKMERVLPDEWDLKDCTVMNSIDGTQIKMFYWRAKEHWVISTTRKIDASQSYFFSKKSFLELFEEVSGDKLEEEKLNRNYCYSFVLCHPENRIVRRHTYPRLYHVLTRDMKTLQLVDNHYIGVPLAPVYTFKKKGDLFRSLKGLPYFNEGYVVRHKDQFIKVVNSRYDAIKKLRGNSNSLLCHYFELKRDRKIQKFLAFYGEYRDLFSRFDRSFRNLCAMVYYEYVLLRIRKCIETNQILPFMRRVLYQIHGIHLKTKRKIEYYNVRKVLESCQPWVLKRMVEAADNLPYSLV